MVGAIRSIVLTAITVAERRLQMCKRFLQEPLMNEAAFVDQAVEWASKLTAAESRGPGDQPNAWRRLETRYGVSAGVFWSLRYRRPKQIAASIYYRLCAAYKAECERQMRRLRNESEIARRVAGPDHPDVRESEAVLADAVRAKKVCQPVPKR